MTIQAVRALRRWTALVLAAVITGGLAAACTVGGPAAPQQAEPESPFAACPAVAADSPRNALPAVTLPCFTGGEPVALDRIAGPAVINFWASWCSPCRAELPELQAFADEVGERVLVLGVITEDGRSAAAWAGIDFGVRFPAVYDPDRSLLRELGRPGLPVTLFVAPDGAVAATEVGGGLTLTRLRELADEHLGIRE